MIPLSIEESPSLHVGPNDADVGAINTPQDPWHTTELLIKGSGDITAFVVVAGPLYEEMLVTCKEIDDLMDGTMYCRLCDPLRISYDAVTGPRRQIPEG